MCTQVQVKFRTVPSSSRGSAVWERRYICQRERERERERERSDDSSSYNKERERERERERECIQITHGVHWLVGVDHIVRFVSQVCVTYIGSMLHIVIQWQELEPVSSEPRPVEIQICHTNESQHAFAKLASRFDTHMFDGMLPLCTTFSRFMCVSIRFTFSAFIFWTFILLLFHNLDIGSDSYMLYLHYIYTCCITPLQEHRSQ